jgi:hypothetical protein
MAWPACQYENENKFHLLLAAVTTGRKRPLGIT